MPTTKPALPSVRFSDPTAPDGVEVEPREFLRQCRASALAHHNRSVGTGWRTVEHVVPRKGAEAGLPTGLIVVHISDEAWRQWCAATPGPADDETERVEAQVHLALEDLAQQDMHGWLAFTPEQRDLFVPDLAQALDEALDRTSFSHIGRHAVTHWEGSLVERLRPPYVTLVVSIGFPSSSHSDGLLTHRRNPPRRGPWRRNALHKKPRAART